MREIVKRENRTAEEEEYYSLVRRAFAALAPFYDIVTAPFSIIRHKVATFADVGNGSRILDVATGTGKQAFAFAKMGHEVVGVDLSEAMLKVANKNNRYPNGKFQVADAIKLPFADESFDASCISFALHDMPLSIRERALKEAVRVTKPKGTIVIVDYALPRNRIGRCLVYQLVKVYERYYYPEFIRSDLKALLRESGIQITGELPVLLGTARMLKGIKRDGPHGYERSEGSE
ncbi:MAG: methyltransferase domain-containing protein [Dehalococcoidia bacterium]|nr:methyltransferase domain-containing protein [Dehalococcoidia bacterium]